MKSVRALALGGLIALAACVSEPAKPPPPAAPPPRVEAPPAPVAPVPPPPEWSDYPLTPGNWSYRSDPTKPEALFAAANPGAVFLIRCDTAGRTLVVARHGVTNGNTMTLRTSTDRRNLPLSIEADPSALVFGTLPASDPFLDSIAFSRGRFTVEVPGMPMLVIPSWSEPARVVEDCRG